MFHITKNGKLVFVEPRLTLVEGDIPDSCRMMRNMQEINTTAINKPYSVKVGLKVSNSAANQTYYQDEMSHCWKFEKHEPDDSDSNHNRETS